MRHCALLVMLCSGAAAAQTAAPEEIPPEAPYWSQGQARPFLALDAEAGAHLRALVSAGYGKPHWLWGGVEAYAFETLDFGALYAGVRASLLVADLQLGARRIFSRTHRAVAVAPSHSLAAFEAAPDLDYTTLTADLSGGLPVPGGYAIYEVEVLHVTDLAQGQELLEEWDHVVTGGSLLAVRLGYLYQWHRLKIGPMADLTATFGRGDTIRIGGVASFALTNHLDIAGLLLIPVQSPDDLGFKGTFGSIRLRWQWATGEANPGFGSFH
jgi:hypothetical protein